ncbi:MAG: 50S ribosomal protein L29 [Saprospiraceae bacterium]|nr:50S ribosomal protein L29 [Saprospiraceae bacterium]MBK6565481.1 50S ribosomal protein L29 [Saprospiraceae bacterium]MBK6784038.1 50S ribosomal protein L29 [Saprospiraceae bacterium]MBK7522750.1 50S ribosomal protein L29 [Saprospiraceae bacterium]MBK8079934.1 50S ribosomal protein L29 [Saprospiraceae bacterium]
MANKTYLELQGLASEAIEGQLKDILADLHRMKYDHASKGLENPTEIKALKKKIAQFRTEIRSREIKEMTPEQLKKRSRIRLRRK